MAKKTSTKKGEVRKTARRAYEQRRTVGLPKKAVDAADKRRKAKAKVRAEIKRLEKRTMLSGWEAKELATLRKKKRAYLAKQKSKPAPKKSTTTKGKTKMAKSTALARRTPIKQSAPYKALAKKLESAKRRAKNTAEYRKEAEGGKIGKAVALTTGVAAAVFLPKETGLDRTGRRVVRLVGGASAVYFGGRIHPLVRWLGWGILASEAVFTGLEMSGAVSGDIGEGDDDDWDDFGAHEDDEEFEDEDEFVMVDAA